MAEPDKPAAGADVPKQNVPKQGNPAFRMLGLPRLRARLPSRNWSIFFTIVGSFSGAVIYDRRHKKQEQQKWCNAVSHMSERPLDPSGLPRKLTVFLSAPPGDGLRPSREYFQEYVKPILVAAAVDWEVVEGRKEGEIRARLAERIRRSRRRSGEGGGSLEGEEDIIQDIRDRGGIQPEDSRGGDLVIGRHTWKEYVRGLHEGWLGPLQNPFEVSTPAPAPSGETKQDGPLVTADSAPNNDPVMSLDAITGDDKAEVVSDDSTTKTSETPDPATSTPTEEKVEPEKPKIYPPPAYIDPSDYSSGILSASTPTLFPPSLVLPQPHILGFINTPTRLQRFLTRRNLARTAGAPVAALLLAPDAAPYGAPADTNVAPEMSSDDRDTPSADQWEQQRVLVAEERDWHKIARTPRAEGIEPVWQDDVVVDPRVGERMRRPVAAPKVATGDEEVTWSEGGAEVATTASAPAIADDGRVVRGNARDWKGGADRGRVVGWGTWFLEATGFADTREVRGPGAKDGWIGNPDE